VLRSRTKYQGAQNHRLVADIYHAAESNQPLCRHHSAMASSSASEHRSSEKVCASLARTNTRRPVACIKFSTSLRARVTLLPALSSPLIGRAKSKNSHDTCTCSRDCELLNTQRPSSSLCGCRSTPQSALYLLHCPPRWLTRLRIGQISPEQEIL